jgi:REP element-mobilizing transposase RayT
MGHTYTGNYIHCVFSTRQRKPTIPAARIPDLCAYFGGIARKENLQLLAAGGIVNHMHLLFLLPASRSLAQAVQKFKGGTSFWLGPQFSWQDGYGAFSVSPSQVPVVKAYVLNQEEHHRTRSFEEEFISLLKNCGIPYDPKYVFG